MKRAVITGAADGIGKALAQAFGASGYAVTGIDRDAERAAATADELQQHGVDVSFLVADLARPEELERIAGELLAGPAIDLLIHNAGISAVGRFDGSAIGAQQAVLDVNLVAPLVLTTELLGGSAFAPGAALVFVSSLSHFVGYPGAAVYAASKDAIASYARSLAAAHPELHVLTVFPGPTRTAHARRYSPDNRREHRRMPPDQLAQLVVGAVRARRRRLIPGRGNQLFAVLGRLLPALTMRLMRKTILEKLP